MKPGETVGTPYEIGRGGPGTWTLSGGVGVSGGDVPYRVRVDVSERTPW